MIVGESHYGSEEWTQDSPSFTKNAVQDWAVDRGSHFFTKIASLCIGKPPIDAMERLNFWESVAFYNYIQEFVGEAPRTRPTAQMWFRSWTPFKAVLNTLKPQLILVLGRQNWYNMPQLGGTAGEPLVGLGNPYADTWLYPTDPGEHAVAFHVSHPSSWGFKFEKFVPLFNEANARVADITPRP